MGLRAEDYMSRGYDRIVSLLDESIDIVDKIETFVGRMDPTKKYEPGLVMQIYHSLLVLRERLVEARMKAYEESTGNR
jgi:preprotein translocase subunit SecA